MELKDGLTSLPETPGGQSSDAKQRWRLPPEERRDELLDAALAVFSELGFEQATLNDVADRVGVTKGCLYHYFESKEKLLLEMVRERKAAHLASSEEIVNSTEGTREERLEALLRQMWAGLQEPGQIELAALTINQMARIPELRKFMLDEVVARKQQTMQRALEQGCCGTADAKAAAAAAAVIPCMILGVALCEHVLKGSNPGGLTTEQLGEAVTQILLKGVVGATLPATPPTSAPAA